MNPASPEEDTLPGFMHTQRNFAAHIRDPQRNPAPQDVEARRMAIYSELFYNNVENFVSSGFPVLRSLYGEQEWHAMVREFFSHHQCQTPLFLEITQEFLDYLQNEREAAAGDPPFLLELAHYEWVELAIAVDEQQLDVTGIHRTGDLLDGIPLLSPLAWPLSYHYPVHRISPEFRPQQPGEQPTHLIVYRDLEDEVGFMEINGVTARLLLLIAAHPAKSGLQLLTQIANELQHPSPETVIQGGLATLQELRAHDILLGTRIIS